MINIYIIYICYIFGLGIKKILGLPYSTRIGFMIYWSQTDYLTGFGLIL